MVVIAWRAQTLGRTVVGMRTPVGQGRAGLPVMHRSCAELRCTPGKPDLARGLALHEVPTAALNLTAARAVEVPALVGITCGSEPPDKL